MLPTGSNSMEGVIWGPRANEALLSCRRVPSSLVVPLLPVCSLLICLALLILTRPTSCLQTGQTHGLPPFPESTHILQQVLSKIWPQRSNLIGFLSVPNNGVPKLSTRLICCVEEDSSSFSSLLVVSNGSRHIGHYNQQKIELSSDTKY